MQYLIVGSSIYPFGVIEEPSRKGET